MTSCVKKYPAKRILAKRFTSVKCTRFIACAKKSIHPKNPKTMLCVYLLLKWTPGNRAKLFLKKIYHGCLRQIPHVCFSRQITLCWLPQRATSFCFLHKLAICRLMLRFHDFFLNGSTLHDYFNVLNFESFLQNIFKYLLRPALYFTLHSPLSIPIKIRKVSIKRQAKLYFLELKSNDF